MLAALSALIWYASSLSSFPFLGGTLTVGALDVLETMHQSAWARYQAFMSPLQVL